jgi:uncharacterized protein
MRVVVTGASGFIGSVLVPHLRAQGHDVVRLVRREPRSADEARWDPAAGTVEPGALDGADGVIHLAGTNIGAKRWTAERRRLILDSRIDGTSTIARAVAAAGVPVLVSASGSDIYGDRGGDLLDESEPLGESFAADVAKAWEHAADPAREAGARVVHMRTAMVLGASDGALPRLLPLFKLGLGGPFGRGRHWWSWISLTDAVRTYTHAVTSDTLRGPVNNASPQPLTNRDFSTVLGRVLRRPSLLPVPRFGPWLVRGKAAVHLLYTSIRLTPRALLDDGFVFAHPTLEQALRHELGR